MTKNERVALDEIIRAMLLKEALELDLKFMNMGEIELECECCGKNVKVSRLLMEYGVRDLMEIICPFCDRPLRLNIPLPEMIQ